MVDAGFARTLLSASCPQPESEMMVNSLPVDSLRSFFATS
jgi:hypothetical protein